MQKTRIGKQKILDALGRELGDDATLTDAIEYLLYLQGIEDGLADVEAGRIISHEELIEQIKTWSK